MKQLLEKPDIDWILATLMDHEKRATEKQSEAEANGRGKMSEIYRAQSNTYVHAIAVIIDALNR